MDHLNIAAIDDTHFYDLLQESIEISFAVKDGKEQMRVKINGNEKVAVRN